MNTQCALCIRPSSGVCVLQLVVGTANFKEQEETTDDAAGCRDTMVARWACGLQAAQPPVFVLNSLQADISVTDPRVGSRRRGIPTGKEPHHLYLTPDENRSSLPMPGDSLTLSIRPRPRCSARCVAL